MLRACLKKQVPAQIHPSNLAKSVFGLRKSYFSTSLLDEGEYVDGDLDLEIQSLGSQSAISERNFAKKYVTFDNFTQNLTQQTSKPSRIFKADIPNSIKSLSGKFKFQLDENDEFNQELRNRQKSQSSSQQVQSNRGAASTTKNFKSLLDNIQKKIPVPDENKSLSRIDYPAKTQESKINDPLKIYLNKFVAESAKKIDQTCEAVEDYIKGEEGVDYIQSAQNADRTSTNFHSQLIKEIADMRELYPKGTVDREKLHEWRIKQEIQAKRLEDIDEVKIYPGSSRGPLPEDDPVFFADWIYTHMPDSSKRFYTSHLQEKQRQRARLGASETQDLSIKHLIHSDIAVDETALTLPEKAFMAQTNAETSFSSHVDIESGEINPIPDNLFMDYQAAQEVIEKWTIFKLYPILDKWEYDFDQTLKNIEQDKEEHLPPSYPSLLRYYNLLPEVARNNPIIINLVRCLEFGKHDMTLEQKEWALNYACEFTLPMDPILENACSEAVISQKYFVPLWEEVMIMEDQESEKESTGMDTAGLPGTTKKRSTSFGLDSGELSKMTQQGRPEHLKDLGNWNAPERRNPHVPEEDPFPVLPLQYYDNDDDFWDDYIQWKEQKWGEQPLIKHKPKFKH